VGVIMANPSRPSRVDETKFLPAEVLFPGVLFVQGQLVIKLRGSRR